MKVIIMRGIPGSGKTTQVEGLTGSKIICSADLAHMSKGQYVFRHERKAPAHNLCLSKFVGACFNIVNGLEKCDYLVCDNTNLTAWEIAPYYRLAEMYELPVEIVRIECDPFTAARRNVHEVPVERVFQMYDTLRREILPSWWKERVVLS